MKLFVALSWLGWLLHFPAGERQVKESAVTFQISNAGFTVDGTLSGLEATVQFDPAHLPQAVIRASVPVNSTGSPGARLPSIGSEPHHRRCAPCCCRAGHSVITPAGS